MRDPMGMNLLTPDQHIATVSEFTRQVRNLLEEQIPEIWLKGEISNFRRQASGHCYFSIKDARSQVAGVMFRGNAAQIPLNPRDGIEVIVYGQVSVYEPRGIYQIIVRYMVEAGVGRLQMEFERLKRKLEGEGLFDAKRKRKIPQCPVSIGFVTSATGAAVRDFIGILRRRHWLGRLVIFPATVQGAGAAAQIVEQIEEARKSALVELLVVGRGGGSLEDLWPFNEEIVARAVAHSAVPVISAVGHEIDFTLCDFAADLRAETPSAAAELITSSFLDFQERLISAETSVTAQIRGRLERAESRVLLVDSRLKGCSPVALIERAYLRLDEMAGRISGALSALITRQVRELNAFGVRLAHLSPEPGIALRKQRLRSCRSRFYEAGRRDLQYLAQRVAFLAKRLVNTGPDNVLNRGFVIVRGQSGKIISDRGGLRTGDRLINQFRDGEIAVDVVRGDAGDGL